MELPPSAIQLGQRRRRSDTSKADSKPDSKNSEAKSEAKGSMKSSAKPPVPPSIPSTSSDTKVQGSSSKIQDSRYSVFFNQILLGKGISQRMLDFALWIPQ